MCAAAGTWAPRPTAAPAGWGYSSTGKGSWASAVAFPEGGCWRITGRAGPTTLSYVVQDGEDDGFGIVVVDTGPLVAAAVRTDADRERYAALCLSYDL